MLKKAFDKLAADKAVGTRVLVSGKQDGKQFDNEPGTIIRRNAYETTEEIPVRFDTWSDGHGVGDHQWNFFDYDRKDFTIVEAPVVKAEPKPKKRPHGAQEYKGNGKHSWERVEGDAYVRTERLRVPGGWLYRNVRGEFTKAMTFVPVPQAVGYAV